MERNYHTQTDPFAEVRPQLEALPRLNPGGLRAAAVTATVTNFSTDGILNPSDPAK